MSGDADLASDPLYAIDTSDDAVTGPAGRALHLELDGFSGPLERLLVLARAQKLDLARLSLRDFLEQLTEALGHDAPINQKAGWVGIASWVVLLRSRLLLPASRAAQLHAEEEAQELQTRLVVVQEMQALAAWLAGRSQLGQSVFARGAPEMLGALEETDHQLDFIEFLWATIELLDDAPDVDTGALYRPFALDLHTVSEARARIFRRMVELSERQLLQDLVPAASGLDPADATSLRKYKSGWTATFTAALEMAKQGEMLLVQDGSFEPIAVAKADVSLSL